MRDRRIPPGMPADVAAHAVPGRCETITLEWPEWFLGPLPARARSGRVVAAFDWQTGELRQLSGDEL